ncbi:MAG: cytochrome c oxidase assembly protein [Ilumatobacteraceae bacterium]
MIAEAANLDLQPWRFQFHPEVWLLVAFLIGSYTYAIRVIGRRVHPTGDVVSRKQVRAFVAAVLLLWVASDWPMHDIAEEYLYSVHMVQHMVLSYFVPPLVWLATPPWLFDVVVGGGRARPAVRFLSRPPIAGLLFNLVIMITHIPALVNRSVSNGPLHYFLHVLVVTSALLMWIPVLGPNMSWRIGYGGKMIYLFLMSVVPTVPAAWLTFAEGVVYKHYDIPIRVWGLSATVDQQVAGAVMKLGGGVFLWTVITYMFFKRFMARFSDEQSYKQPTLTFEDVAEAFEKTPAAAEPQR